jgi:hypothetical protein
MSECRSVLQQKNRTFDSSCGAFEQKCPCLHMPHLPHAKGAGKSVYNKRTKDNNLDLIWLGSKSHPNLAHICCRKGKSVPSQRIARSSF